VSGYGVIARGRMLIVLITTVPYGLHRPPCSWAVSGARELALAAVIALRDHAVPQQSGQIWHKHTLLISAHQLPSALARSTLAP